MKFALVGMFALMAVTLCGISSCEEKAAEQYGMKIQEDPKNPGKYIVTEDPARGNVGKVLTTAKEATDGIPIAGQIVGGLSLVGNVLYAFLRRRMQAKVEAMNNATNAGLQSFVDAHPPAIGQALLAELDHAHDAAGVHAEHQDAIQPLTKAA